MQKILQQLTWTGLPMSTGVPGCPSPMYGVEHGIYLHGLLGKPGRLSSLGSSEKSLLSSRFQVRQCRVLGMSRFRLTESIQPHGTIVSCQTPLAYNDRTEFTLHQCNLFLLCASILEEGKTGCGVHPRLVDVGIQCAIGTSLHEATPNIRSKPK